MSTGAPAPPDGVRPRRRGALLLGSPRDPADRRAARWFLATVWPMVRAAVPDAEVTVPAPAPRWWGRPPSPGEGVRPADDAQLPEWTGCAVVPAAVVPLGGSSPVRPT